MKTTRVAMSLQAKTAVRRWLSAGLSAGALAGVLPLTATPALANGDNLRGLEQMLTIAQQDKKGVTLYIGGQTVGGAVTRIEPGQWVELRNQQFGRLVIRLDRIDAVALP